jgi:hypothetical protein
MSFFKRLMFAIFGNWSAAFAVGIVSVGAATVIAIMAYAEFQQLKSGKDDARWSVFELGFEYQRFMLAAERGESLVDMRLRGDIYLSRVLILRDAPLLAHVREGIGTEKLQALFKSAHETDRLLQGLDSLNQRDGLIRHLSTTLADCLGRLAFRDSRIGCWVIHGWSASRRADHGQHLEV